MLNCAQLKEFIIKPALLDLVMYSDNVMELLVFTCANESDGGTYIKQVNGPALGIYQMEPATYNDIWVNDIAMKNNLKLILLHSFDCNRMPSEERMIYDMRYATAMARIFYARISEPLPSANDTGAIWNYYKQYYNTNLGKADYLTALRKYDTFKNT